MAKTSYVTNLLPSQRERFCKIAESVEVSRVENGQQISLPLWQAIGLQFIGRNEFSHYEVEDIKRRARSSSKTCTELVLEHLARLAVPLKHLFMFLIAHHRDQMFEEIFVDYIKDDEQVEKFRQQQRENGQAAGGREVVRQENGQHRVDGRLYGAMTTSDDCLDEPSSVVLPTTVATNIGPFAEAMANDRLKKFLPDQLARATDNFSDHYRLPHQGNFGDHFRVYSAELGGDVIIKRFCEISANWKKTAAGKAFEKTVRTLQQLDHDNVLKLIGISIHRDYKNSGYYCTVVKYYQNGSLWELLRARPLPWPHRTIISLRLVEALHYCHSKGVVHGDLKPSNVLVNDQLLPILADFDTATDKNRNHSSDKTTSIIGSTHDYLPPEGATLAKPADVWMMGVLLAQMLSYRPPSGHESAGTFWRLSDRFIRLRSKLGNPDVSSIDGPLIRSESFFDRYLYGILNSFQTEVERRLTAEQLAEALRQTYELFTGEDPKRPLQADEGFSLSLNALLADHLIDKRLLPLHS